jgi:uncharacterized membrane protein
MKPHLQVFTVVIGIIGIFATLVLSGQSIKDLQSFRQVVPSLFFIALSVNIATVVEAIDFLVNTGPPSDPVQKKLLTRRLLSAIAYSLGCFLVFAVSITKSLKADFVLHPVGISMAALLIVLSIIQYYRVADCVRRV